RNERPVGTQSSTRSARRSPLAASAAAQVPAPWTHSPNVIASSRNEPRAALRRMWTATRSGSRWARASSRAVIESSIRDESLHQAPPQTALETARRESAALQLVRHQRPVAVQDTLALQAFQSVAPHLPRGKAQLAPDGLGEKRGDAGPYALEHQVLHLRQD